MAVSVARLLVLSILTTCLMLTSGAPRVRRQLTGFTIIGNETLPCTTMTEQYGSDEPVDLTEEEKQELFRQYGGQFLAGYMATSREEAVKNFVSPIPLEKRFEERIKLSRPSDGIPPTNKQVISDYMMKHVYNGFTEINSQQNTEEADSKTSSESRSSPGKDSKFHSTKQRFHEIMDSISDEKNIQKRRQVWRSWSKENDGDGDFPLIFPEMLGLPKTVRNSDNSISMTESCLTRGDYTSVDEEHVRLCTVCSSTTSFGPDMWPQYINEAQCMVGDDGCLFTDTLANGSCQQVMMSLSMLQKNSEYCVLVLRDGQTIVAYEWEFVSRDIGVGCECNVKSGSYFVYFV